MNQILTPDRIRSNIIHYLTVYPRLSPTMLQVGLGTNIPPMTWRPILQDLVKEGKVKIEEVMHPTPSGRTRAYEVLTLAA